MYRVWFTASLVFLLGGSIAHADTTTKSSLDLPAVYSLIADRLAATYESVSGEGVQPDVIYSGETDWSIAGPSWWTSGFYPGMLWMMYRQTGDSTWLDMAEEQTAVQIGQEYNDYDHDVGFRVFCSFGQGYASLSSSSTLQAEYKDYILTAATTLAGRYNSTYNAIESWDGDKVIIDNMMNLELLFWAAENGAENAEYLYNIAVTHATTTLNEHLRSDGSTYHIVYFDDETGEVLDKYTSQGLGGDSIWSRGQAWGIYGFTMTYRYTDDEDFLNAAISMAEYWLANLPEDDIALYDFCATDETLKDSSATAIAASGLLELMQYVDEDDAQRYFEVAEAMLIALTSLAFDSDEDYAAILTDGTKGYGSYDMALIYGDYYFLEALQRYEAIVSTTPEPATIGLLMTGAVALLRRRTR